MSSRRDEIVIVGGADTRVALLTQAVRRRRIGTRLVSRAHTFRLGDRVLLQVALAPSQSRVPTRTGGVALVSTISVGVGAAPEAIATGEVLVRSAKLEI